MAINTKCRFMSGRRRILKLVGWPQLALLLSPPDKTRQCLWQKLSIPMYWMTSFRASSIDRFDSYFYEHAKQCQSTGQFCLPFCLSSGHLVEYSTNEAREALEHRLLRPLSSNLRSEGTSEVIWRPLWPQRPP